MRAEREAEIESCFLCSVDFHYPNGLETFNDLLGKFKACSNTAKTKALDIYFSEEVVNNGGFGEKTKRDQHIVMNDVSGLADESKNLQVFKLLYVNLITIVFIFSTQFIKRKQIGKQFFHKRIFSIIFPASVLLTSA